MEIDERIAPGIVAALAGGVITWIAKGYFTKIGENSATKEDIADITAIQKEVETKIGEEAWHRQQQWTKKEGLYSSAFDAINKAFVEVYTLTDLNSRLKGKLMLRDAEGERRIWSEMEEGRKRLITLLSSLRTIQNNLSLHSQSEAVALLGPLGASLGALANPVPFENRVESKMLYEAEEIRGKFQQAAKVDLDTRNGAAANA